MAKIILLLIALYFTLFGLATLFSSRFLEYMRKTFWYKSDMDKKIFPAKWARFDEISNIGLPMIFTGIAIFIFVYYVSKIG
jgi:hypothetical protein